MQRSAGEGKAREAAICHIGIESRVLRIGASGEWRIAYLDPVDRRLRELTTGSIAANEAVIDLSGITRFDTAAATILDRTERLLEEKGLRVSFEGVSDSQQLLLDKIGEFGCPAPSPARKHPLYLEIVGRIGETTRAVGEEVTGMLGF